MLLSTGDMVLFLPKTITRRETAIKKTQRNMARKQRGSRRYLKKKRRLNRLVSRNARARSQTAHVLSRRLANSYGMVALEDLRIKAMTASARGTVEAPGQRVKQKSGLNRAILGVGWYRFETMLSYKLEENGGR